MIDFELSDETRMVVETAESFAAAVLRPAHRVHEDAGAVGAEAREAFEKTGLALLDAAPDGGGAGLGALARVLALGALGWGDAGAALALVGPDWTAAAARVLGVDAGGAGAPTGMHAAHRLDATPEILDWVPAAGAGPWLVFDGTGRWWLCRGEGVPVRALGLAASGARRIRLDQRLAEGCAPAGAGPRAIALLRLGIASLAMGVARASFEHAARYVQERVAFGRRLADHQGVAFMVAEGAMRVEAARALLTKAAHRFDAGDAADAAFAFLECAEAALWMTDTGVQLLGGHGYLREHPVEKWMRDARALTLFAGGLDAARADAGEVAWSGEWI